MTVAVPLLLVGAHQQVGPAPLPLLAPGGHGGADPGQRLPARRVDGQGRRLPRRAAGARVRRRDRVAHGAPGARPHARCSSAAWRALRQYDLKLLLAYGTVSQLGFLCSSSASAPAARCSPGSRCCSPTRCSRRRCSSSSASSTTSTGTRDLRELSGSARPAPVLAVAGRRSPAASMAGLPPLIGFVGKESVLSAPARRAPATATAPASHAGGWLVVVGVVARVGPDRRPTRRASCGGPSPTSREVAGTGFGPAPRRLRRCPVLARGLSSVLGFARSGADAALSSRTPTSSRAGAHDAELCALARPRACRWCCPSSRCCSALALFVAREPLRPRRRRRWSPTEPSAATARHAPVDRSAVEVTGVTQRGSVAAYLAVILRRRARCCRASPLLAALDGRDVVRLGHPGPGRRRRRHRRGSAVRRRARGDGSARCCSSGVTGYGTALLFLLHGAPDLALTQVLVETLTAGGLRAGAAPAARRTSPTARCSRQRYLRGWRSAWPSAVVVAGFMLVAARPRTADPVSAGFAEGGASSSAAAATSST